MDHHKLLWQTSTVFAPDFPRRCSDDGTMQARRDSRPAFVDALKRASENGMPGYYSVYSFPRGEPKDGHIPKVDTVFIDLDVTGENYDPNGGKTGFIEWKTVMSALLARARMIARAIIEEEEAHHFRVVLSGHKGLHLYLDFPAISPDNAESMGQFKNGLRSYGENVMNWLDTTAGGVNIDPWVDVDASDLARLARHPNTIHHGAAYDDETRWCVPITVEELADLHWQDYLDYTQEPRLVPDSCKRIPSESAGQKVAQHVRTAPASSRSRGSRSRFDPQAVEEYKANSNDDLTLDDVLFFTANKPCIRAFRNRDDAYDHGEASRTMELSIMGRFVEMGVPVEVMHEFFAEIPGYDRDYTQELIEDIIGRKYHEFNCENIVGTDESTGRAPQFCLGDDCKVYRNETELQQP